MHARFPTGSGARSESRPAKILRSLFRVMIGQSQPIGLVLGVFRAFPSITGSYPTK